mgnify:FL=1
MSRIFGFRSNLRKSEHYRDIMDSTQPDSLKDSIQRYIYAVAARDYMKGHYQDVAVGKTQEHSIEEAVELLRDADNVRWFEEKRLRSYNEIDDVASLLPDRTRPFKSVGKLGVAAVIVAILGAAGLTGYNEYSYRDNSSNIKNKLIPELVALLKKEDVKGAREKAFKDLNDAKFSLPRGRYKEIWDEVEGKGKDLENIERLFKAKEKFSEAQQAAKNTKYAEALGLIADLGGVNALLGDLNEKDLPDYARASFVNFIKDVRDFNIKYAPYRASSIQFNPIKNDIPKIKNDIATLEEVLKKGELFELVRADNLLETVRSYLGILRNVEPEAVGQADLETVRKELRAIEDSIDGNNGLLTSYELVEFNRFKTLSEQLKALIKNVKSTGYLDESIASEITKLRILLDKTKDGLSTVDSRRVETYQTVNELNVLESEVVNAGRETEKIGKLKESAKGGDLTSRVNAASELAQRYFNRDHKEKKWDKVLEYLSLIPEPRSETVEHIGEIVSNEERLTKPEGKILVTTQGLTESDLVGYNLTIENFKDKNVTKDLEWEVQKLLKRADLEEGKTVLNLIKELNLLKLSLGTAGNKEESIELGKKIDNIEGKLFDNLNKFGTNARILLEKGESIEDPTLLEILAMHYGKVGKNDVAQEYEKKKAELKAKYHLE